MKCNICKAELKPDHYYVFAETLWRAKDNYHMYEEAVYDITIKVCDDCEHELMRLYRELREDVADHI